MMIGDTSKPTVVQTSLMNGYVVYFRDAYFNAHDTGVWYSDANHAIQWPADVSGAPINTVVVLDSFGKLVKINHLPSPSYVVHVMHRCFIAFIAGVISRH
jgi:hypothetical protein